MRFVTSKQRKEIAEFFERTRETARTVFERDGLCVPVAILLLEDQQAVLPLASLGKNKDIASLLLKKLIEKTRPLAFVLVTEAWMAKAGDAAAATGGPHDDLEQKYHGALTENTPDGKEKPKEGVQEAVMLQCSSVTGENFMLTAEVIRNPEGKPALKAWERQDNRDAVGRFVFDVTPLETRQ